MPRYYMACRECGHYSSVYCEISEKNQQKCPKCGSQNIEQRFTSVDIRRISQEEIGSKPSDNAYRFG